MRRKRRVKHILKAFIVINLLSFLVFISAVDGNNYIFPLVIIFINLINIVISGFFY